VKQTFPGFHMLQSGATGIEEEEEEEEDDDDDDDDDEDD
jgi:hypothetical protein